MAREGPPGLPRPGSRGTTYTRAVFPQPTTSQLRAGLHVLVLALAAVVLLRAVLLDEPRSGWISLTVLAFAAVYLLRTRLTSGSHLTLVVLVALWVVLVLLGADAAYVSVGLFLVFLTELAFVPAIVCVVASTALDVALGLARGAGGAGLLAPVLGALLAVLFGVGYRVLFDATARQRSLIEELRRTRAELAESERAAGQAAERQRLAQEIHDTVAQGLSSIQLLLHAVEAEPLPEGARGRVALARETAASGLEETRRMIAQLAPADLAGSTLTAALGRVCERAVAPVTLLLDGEPAPVPMPVEAALVRVAQSALANVDQHAGPGARAVVTLAWQADRVRLDVVDDGRGFDAAALSRPDVASFGLDTIRHRVSELGGDVSVESEPGHTALAVSFPLAGASGRDEPGTAPR